MRFSTNTGGQTITRWKQKTEVYICFSSRNRSDVVLFVLRWYERETEKRRSFRPFEAPENVSWWTAAKDKNKNGNVIVSKQGLTKPYI